ncbi:hypothetical protein BDM02DRAFT_3179669 [Thelephora ganbajun]|uniref:Uncharacterized protein n=1 Tax=Thelephora ganbajun TaxID=370292 RepID=A0ACB6ZIC8_THEGA|nr:hypothetical protein BDM02DRAFT_3179669 [Thelephora ganbajun]
MATTIEDALPQEIIPSAFEDAVVGESEEAKAARAVKQVEFYFADVNLPFDKFMWGLHSANDDHWVPLATITSFKRMLEFQMFGQDWIVSAICKLSTFLEVDGSGINVRRTTEVQEPKGHHGRSVYAKGFGAEVPGLQRKLETFFSKFGNVNAVRMRRIDKSKEFKGSIFVEFADFETVDKFLNADPRPTWEGKELLIMTKDAYCEMKIQEKGLRGKSAAARKDSIARHGFNAFREMAKKKGTSSPSIKTKKPDIKLEFMGSKIPVQVEDSIGSVNKEDVPFVRGATLKFEGDVGDASFNQIKDPLRVRFERVPYIRHNRGDSWGLLGFDKKLAEEDIQFVKDSCKIEGKIISWSIPPEDEEHEFQINRADFAASRAISISNSKSGRGG